MAPGDIVKVRGQSILMTIIRVSPGDGDEFPERAECLWFDHGAHLQRARGDENARTVVAVMSAAPELIRLARREEKLRKVAEQFVREVSDAGVTDVAQWWVKLFREAMQSP